MPPLHPVDVIAKQIEADARIKCGYDIQIDWMRDPKGNRWVLTGIDETNRDCVYDIAAVHIVNATMVEQRILLDLAYALRGRRSSP
jgi:hypothetical protein